MQWVAAQACLGQRFDLRVGTPEGVLDVWHCECGAPGDWSIDSDFSARVCFHAQEVEPSLELHLSFTSALNGDHVQPQVTGRSTAKPGP